MKQDTSHKDWKLSPEDDIKILALSRLDGFGSASFQLLLKRIDRIGDISQLSLSELKKFLKPDIAEQIHSQKYLSGIEKYKSRLDKLGISYTSLVSDQYPFLLSQIYDPPIVLFRKGSLDFEDVGNCFAVVGTRNCTKYGEEVSSKIVEKLVRADITIVSGMAFGIDKIAHTAALENGGKTIAVLSGGVNEPVPRTNRDIYEKILDSGCVISEDYVGTEIQPFMFALRNRIVSGISMGTLVVEAGRKSGALITASCALEQGREVFALPSDVIKLQGRGTNKLIQKGEAKLVTNAQDILVEFGVINNAKTDHPMLRKEEKKIIAALTQKKMTIDELSRNMEMDVSSISTKLAVMELEKKVVKVDGNQYAVFLGMD